jgi:hypothetical protein
VTTGYNFSEIGAPIASSDLLRYDEFLESRFHREWMRPQGLADCLHATPLTPTSARLTPGYGISSIAPRATVLRTHCNRPAVNLTAGRGGQVAAMLLNRSPTCSCAAYSGTPPLRSSSRWSFRCTKFIEPRDITNSPGRLSRTQRTSRRTEIAQGSGREGEGGSKESQLAIGGKFGRRVSGRRPAGDLRPTRWPAAPGEQKSGRVQKNSAAVAE